MQYLPRCLPLIFVTLLAGLLTVPAAAQQNTTIAVVDVERLFSESAAGKALGEQLDGVRTEVQGRINALQREVQEIRAQLQQLAPDSERALDLQRQGVVKEGQLQAELQFGQARVNNLMLQSNLLVLNLTKQAVADVAQQKKIGIVLRKAPPLPNNVSNQRTEELQSAVLRQVALYAAPEYDISSDVLVRMDAIFRSGQSGAGGTGPGATGPTTQPTGGGGSPPR